MKQYSDKNAVFALLDGKGIPYHKQEHGAVHTMKDVDSSAFVWMEYRYVKQVIMEHGGDAVWLEFE